MTPAIEIVKTAKINFHLHEYNHDPGADSYGKEAAIRLGIDSTRVFKTLVVALDGKNLAVGVLPVSTQLNLKLYAKAVGIKKVTMADRKVVERTTGYLLGGISPLGQKKRLTTIIDNCAKHFKTIYVSGGRRGLEIELSPDDLCLLTGGKFRVIGN
ncbi:MAG: Cys-tRNA(Pro) deacylase [Desulfobacteraceae bacterium]|nr:Cys-tRNA(Pro) deacylase [Desulfobacteraceae bacterium]